MEGTEGAAYSSSQDRSAERIRVLVAAEDPLVREALRSRLAPVPGVEIVGEAADGEEAVRVAQELQPSALLLDLRLPGGGAETARALRSAAPEVRVLVLSAAASVHHARALARLGVRGYLARTATTDELLRSLRAAHAGGTYVEPTLAGLLLPPPGAPTDRELAVLQLVADGLRYREIGRRLAITDRTVRFHVQNLRRKTGAASRAELLRLARQGGWIE